MESGGALALISFPSANWVEEMKLSYGLSNEVIELLHKLSTKQKVPKDFASQHGLILKNERILVVPKSPFKENVLNYVHSSPQAGHAGFLKTYERAKAYFYWIGMKRDIKKLVCECDIY
ncbi:hypothetical protein CIPAW_15G089900 [Carya illinoinensis]|uniref:Integrase zinc-binding domain-containing protein n=1 Tax=Carya illinoinensis TaxID=32201 RepID=A0A8T1NDN7_CARIL|nr:hypothetical protein CIPAW_15G089900 [Carya illinoinensis]